MEKLAGSVCEGTTDLVLWALRKVGKDVLGGLREGEA